MLLHALIDGTERSLLVADFEDLVRDGRIDAETPVSVGGAPAVPARTLAVYRDVVDTPAAHFRAAWDRPAIPWATALLAGLCIRVYLWGVGDWLGALARSSDNIVLRGQSWRLLTYAFLHGSPGHILSNLTFFVFMAMSLERVVGPWAILALWIASTAGGGLLATWFLPDATSVGASGGDYGFLAAAAVLGWRWLDLIPRSARTRFGGAMGAFTLYSFYGGTQNEGVDSWCHLGGLLVGGMFGALMRPISGAGRQNLPLAAGAVVVTVLAMAGIRLAGWRLLPLEEAHADGIVGVRPAWWGPGWTKAGGTGWAERTADGLGGVDGVGAAEGMATERRGRDWTMDDAVDDVLQSYTDADPGARVERGPVALDGIVGERLTLTWTSPARKEDPAVPMDSVVDVFVRGHYRTTFSWDAPRDTPDAAGLLARLREPLHLVDPDALKEVAQGDGLRARTLRARALFEVGRRDEALGLFSAGVAAGEAKELLAALTLCGVETDRACEPGIRAASAFLDRAPGALDLRAALIRAEMALGDHAAAVAILDAGLATAPDDAVLLTLKEALGVSTTSPE